MFSQENMTTLSFSNPIIIIAILVILICLSGMFSGLTLGLMSLDEGFLNILITCRCQIKKEVKELLKNFENLEKKEDNFDIIDDIEEDKIIEWLNNLNTNLQENNKLKIDETIIKITRVKAKQELDNLKLEKHTKKRSRSVTGAEILSHDDQLMEEHKQELQHQVEMQWMGKQAENILPIRRNGNFLLVVILIGNVIVNNVISILLAQQTSGLIGLLLSTGFIVIFGEILPQAFCNKHSLQVGSLMSEPMKVLLCLFQVVAKPVSLLVDLMVGDDIKENFSRNQMQALIKSSKGLLEDEEKKIIQGMLELKNVSVSTCMTPIDGERKDAYMIDGDRTIDSEFIKEIYTQGYSRIPVYLKDRNDITGIFYVKDLLLIDSERDETVNDWMNINIKRNKLECNEFDSLFTVLSEMKKHKVHIALIKNKLQGREKPAKDRNNSRTMNNHKDQSSSEEEMTNHNTKEHNALLQKQVGLITMEDIIEKLIGEEIYDEKDDKDMNRRTYKLFSDESLDAITEFHQHETQMIASQLIDHEMYFSDFSVRELQEMLSQCDIINFLSDINHDKFSYSEVEIQRENFKGVDDPEIANSPKKKDTSGKTLTLRKLNKKPIGMKGNQQEMNVKDELVKKDHKIDSAFLVLSGTVKVCIGKDDIEKVFKKFEIINIKLINKIYETYKNDAVRSSQIKVNAINKTRPDYKVTGTENSSVLRIAMSDQSKLLRSRKITQEQANVLIDLQPEQIEEEQSLQLDEDRKREMSIRHIDLNSEMEVDENFFANITIENCLDNMIIPNLDTIEGENKYKSQIRRGGQVF